MEKFESYSFEKKQLLGKITMLKERLFELKEMGVDVEDAFTKLDETVKSIDSDVISIVLVGSFSDGKTSVVAGWLGEKNDNMKIDRDESSDQLEIYHPSSLPEKCEIVDTPGLFGDKEKSDENGGTIKLSDVTRKYIDQANLILYVVEAKNPIKQSHFQTVEWILKDLHKLDNTIFVINKMDDVVDVTDSEEYQKMSKIKSDTLRNKVKEIASLSDSDASKLKIVTISSDPGARGFDFWKERQDKYEERSHIIDLEKTTDEIIKGTTASSLVTKTGYDVLCRVVNDKVEVVSEQLDLIVNDMIPTLSEGINRNKADVENAKIQILKNRTSYQRKLREYENNLMSEIRALTPSDIGAFVTDKIGVSDGEYGYHLEQDINIISQEFLNSANTQLDNLFKKLTVDMENRNEFVEGVLSKTGKGASTALKVVGKVPVAQMKNMVFAGRELLGKIGIAIKFKPWGATKLASGLVKGLPLLGAGIDVALNLFEIFKQKRDQEKFKTAISDLSTFVSGFFKNVQDQIADENAFMNQFAPQIPLIEEKLKSDEIELERYIDQKTKIEEWRVKTEQILK